MATPDVSLALHQHHVLVGELVVMQCRAPQVATILCFATCIADSMDSFVIQILWHLCIICDITARVKYLLVLCGGSVAAKTV